MIALAALLSLIGFFALCLAMPRHHGQLLGGKPSNRRRRALRIGGWLALALAALASVQTWGLAYAVLGWLGLSTLAAAIVLLTLTYWPPRAPPRSRP